MNHLANTRRCRIRLHGVIVAFVAAVALAGHFLNVPELASWFGLVPMSIPAAFCILLLASNDIELSIADTLWGHKTPPPANG